MVLENHVLFYIYSQIKKIFILVFDLHFCFILIFFIQKNPLKLDGKFYFEEHICQYF